jgi:D-3-phosphoglycerate dehydrogenase / 2-oxoglutarate reductase
MEKKRIAVTIRSFDRNSDYFQRLQDMFEISYINSTGCRLEKQDLILAIQNSEGVIAGTEIFDRDVLASVASLKVFSRVGVGMDSIDLEYARLHNIRIFNTPNAPVEAVAEHTIALMLALLKRIPLYDHNVKNGDFTVGSGELLAEKTIGIIGLGRIGFRVASVLGCFNAKIIFFDPYLKNTTDIPDEWTRMNDLESLLSGSDIITLHATPSSDNRPLLDTRAFSSCKKGIIIINTARESLIDEEALVVAIREGIVGGIAFDVFNQNHMATLIEVSSDVILTPHIASNTRYSRTEMESEAVNNLILGFREVP